MNNSIDSYIPVASGSRVTDQPELSKLSKLELLEKCKELGITQCSSKNKSQIIERIQSKKPSSTPLGQITSSDDRQPQMTYEPPASALRHFGVGGFHPPVQNIIISTDNIPGCGIQNNVSDTTTHKYTFIEVCAGGGGLSSGLIKSGFTPVLLNDNNSDCCKTLKHNHTHANVVCGSMDKIDYSQYVNKVDLLTGGVPCFIAGTRVSTNSGYKNIEDVLLEDKLLTHTGKFQNIINLQRKLYTGDLYDLKIKYHPEIISCTEEHPFYVREKVKIWDNSIRKYKITYNEPVWKPAKELTKNDYFGMVINTNEIVPEFTFDKKINQTVSKKINIILNKPEYWYMMGYFVGDGWIEETTKKHKSGNERPQYMIKFAINNKDETEVCEKIRKILPIVDKKSSTGKCKKFGCRNQLWFEMFKMFGKYSHGKKIPEWVQDAPKEFIQEFINGYMKADGNICDNGTFQITTVSYNLAYGLQRLYLKLGHIFSVNKYIRPKTCIIDGRTVNQRDTYCIRGISTRENNMSSFIEDNYVWYAPFKQTKYKTMNTPVYNFEVENDNSYVVDNTICHNCQSFSQAGLRKGLDDPRGDLMMKFIEILNLINPKTFMIENVKGLLTHDDGDTIKKIIEALNKNNLYNISYKCLDASKYDVPQKRERVFIVGVLKSIPGTFAFPEESKTRVVLKDVLYDVPSSNGAKYSDEKKALFKMIPQGGCWVNLPEHLQREYLGNSFHSGGGKRGILYRLSMEKPSLTLLCTPSQKQTERCHPLEERPLTIREYARIQTFDDTYEFIGGVSSQYKQIGNAVPVELAKHMGKSLLELLRVENIR